MLMITGGMPLPLRGDSLRMDDQLPVDVVGRISLVSSHGPGLRRAALSRWFLHRRLL